MGGGGEVPTSTSRIKKKNFFSPITRHIKGSKYIANFTFSTLKVSLKGELTITLPIQPQNLIVNYSKHFPPKMKVVTLTGDRENAAPGYSG